MADEADREAGGRADLAAAEPGARRAYAQAAARAGVEVRELQATRELEEARHVCDAVWPTVGGGTQVTANLLRAIEHAGGYVVGAYDGSGAPIGAALGFLGRRADGSGETALHLHSHMAAVLPAHRDRRVGTALKLHQRWWALREGIPAVAWTFDPLVRRNARVNLALLGADVIAYLPDFYGDMDDEVNAGDRTDRLLAWWRVASPRARAAARGEVLVEPEAELVAAGAEPALRVVHGVPEPTGAQGPVVLVPLPADIVALRITDPGLALAWRLAVRTALHDAVVAGDHICGVTDAGSYVLRR